MMRLAIYVGLASWMGAVLSVSPVWAQSAQGLRLGEVCRVKGQEPVTLQGFGIVIGLRGTGDGKSPLTLRKLARILEMSGNPVGKDNKGMYLPEELQDSKNVALVAVTAEIPSHGGREGDKLNCQVSAVAAKSLEGGYLFKAALQGPAGDNRVYAFAEGPLSIPDPAIPTTANIRDGCQLLETFKNPFVHENKITLVLDRPYAGFQTASEVALTINKYNNPSFFSTTGPGIARAIDGTTVEVEIPEAERNTVVEFVAAIQDQRIILQQKHAVVRVDEKTGTIVATKDARIGPVVVTHRNLTIESGQQLVANFVDIDSQPAADGGSVKGLVDALNAMKVPPRDVIAILRKIHEAGALYARFEEN